MLYLITASEADKVKKVKDIESRFDVLVNSGVKFKEDIYTFIMEEIDNVTFRNDDIIETPFGRTLITNLSSGCKAVILAMYYNDKDIYICIDECGNNALKVLFELSKKWDVKTYINREIALEDDTITCKINNEQLTGGYHIYRKMVSLNE